MPSKTQGCNYVYMQALNSSWSFIAWKMENVNPHTVSNGQLLAEFVYEVWGTILQSK